jgi:hypothetical protein
MGSSDAPHGACDGSVPLAGTATVTSITTSPQKQTPPNLCGLGGAGGWRHRSGFGGNLSKAHARKTCGSW